MPEFHEKLHYSKMEKQLTFPIAKRPLSKKNSTPRNRKNTPNPDTPMPISAYKKYVRNRLATQAEMQRGMHQSSYFDSLLWEACSYMYWSEIYSPVTIIFRGTSASLEKPRQILKSACSVSALSRRW